MLKIPLGRRNRRGGRGAAMMTAAILLITMQSGCNLFGPVGGVVAKAIPRYADAPYKGLPGQTVGVMVWAERSVRDDNPYIQVDLATGLQEKLKAAQANDDPKELKGTTFPIRPESIVEFQQNHPELESAPIAETAAKFNVSRLIYIEINDFSTRSDASLALYRGTISVNMKVLSIRNGVVKTAFEENDIAAVYPKDSPKEGLPVGTDEKIYQGTLDRLSKDLSYRVYTHEEEDDATE